MNEVSRKNQMASMKTLLEKASIPFDELTVFGSLGVNVHVVCRSVSAANKWSVLLRKVLGPKASIVSKETWVTNKKNTNSVLLPSGHKAFFVGAIA